MMRTILFLSIFSFTMSFAQFDEDLHKSAPSPFNPITVEAIPYWSEDTTSIELMVFYRINPAFFFFAKTSTARHETYEAHGEIVFELFDEKDAAIARQFRPLRVERNLPPAEDIQFSEEIQGALKFNLKKGLYKIVVESKDNESSKSFINRKTIIDTRTFSPNLNISPAIFVESISSDTSLNKQNEFFPLNRGGSIIIGQTGGCLIQSPITGHKHRYPSFLESEQQKGQGRRISAGIDRRTIHSAIRHTGHSG